MLPRETVTILKQENTQFWQNSMKTCYSFCLLKQKWANWMNSTKKLGSMPLTQNANVYTWWWCWCDAATQWIGIMDKSGRSIVKSIGWCVFAIVYTQQHIIHTNHFFDDIDFLHPHESTCSSMLSSSNGQQRVAFLKTLIVFVVHSPKEDG